MMRSVVVKVLLCVLGFGWAIPCLMGISLYVQHLLTSTATEADQWVKALAKLAAHGLFIISGAWLAVVVIVFVVIRLLALRTANRSST